MCNCVLLIGEIYGLKIIKVFQVQNESIQDILKGSHATSEAPKWVILQGLYPLGLPADGLII